MLNLAQVERCLDWDNFQGALADYFFLFVLGPFGFCCGLAIESRFLFGWACAFGASGVGPSTCFHFWSRVSEVY